MKADYHTAAALTSTRARQIRRSLPSERCSRDEQPAISTVYEMIFRAAQRRSRVPSTSCPCPFALVSGADGQALSDQGGYAAGRGMGKNRRKHDPITTTSRKHRSPAGTILRMPHDGRSAAVPDHVCQPDH
ncbi:MAG: hypothetical protein ACXU84_24680 [Xanthobacteraceae bacterium]